MIKSFRHKGLAALYETGNPRKVQPKHAKRLNLILTALNAATQAAQMAMPGMRFHPLHGNRYSVWADENYRVTFRFDGGHAYEVAMKTIIESSGRMHNPAHPGEILKEMYMGPLGVSITQTADALGVSRKHVSAIVNGRVPVSPDMAARLAGVFGTEPDIWINLQAQYDLWQVRQHGRPKVKRLAA